MNAYIIKKIIALVLFAPAMYATAQQCCLVQPATTQIATETIAQDLNQPWAMAFLPDASILVTERDGALRRIESGKVSAPFTGLPRISSVGQGGLLDIALDPDFKQSQTIFFTFTEPAVNARRYSTAVARARINLNTNSLSQVKIIFSANNKSRGGRHFGSRIRFAPDKTLFVTLGDRGSQPRAQDPFDHAGSVIRIHRDGSVPADNPFADGKQALPEIWSIGHRNAQGALLHPRSGKLWTLAHGAAGGDEINIVEAGRNYGWPLISYGSNYSGRSFEKGATAAGLEQPAYYWDPSIAPSGFTFYAPENPLLPDWHGSLLAGALRGRHLARLLVDGERIVGEEKYLDDVVGRIRDVRTGPDGAVWLLTDSRKGKLIRVTQKN